MSVIGCSDVKVSLSTACSSSNGPANFAGRRSSSGNAGAQSGTLMVRALATGEIKLRDWGYLLGKECLVAGLLGLTMAAAVVGLGWWRGGYDIADVAGVVLYFSIATWYLGL